MKQIEMNIHTLPYAMEEAMNRLRINMKFCGKNTKKILVTSSIPGEGKSTISVHLWKMLSEAGFSSVLLDMDLRKSVLKERYKYDGQKDITGLDFYLSGLCEYQDVVYATNVENGYVVPVSHVLENPSALLEDPRMKELLDRLAEEYRYVIVDSPPLDSVADGALIASMCDGVILVVRSSMTNRRLIRQSLKQLKRVNCRLLGTVLNRVETRSRAYRKYYGRYGRYDKYGSYGYGPDGGTVSKEDAGSAP